MSAEIPLESVERADKFLRELRVIYREYCKNEE
jgi:hypothetical protein